MSTLTTTTLVVIASAAAIAIAIGLAYVPMRLLLMHMARHVKEFIERQRDRRNAERGTPDRRRV